LVFFVQQHRSWKHPTSSTPSAAYVCRLTSNVYTRPIQKPVMDSGISTSKVRPFLRSATALNVGLAARGSSLHPSSPATVPTSSSTVETERDLIAFANLSVGPFVLLLGTYVFFLLFMRSSVTYCTSTTWN
jgi:hypothetical protein